MCFRLFDTHCHLQDPRLSKDLEAVLARAAAVSVEAFVCCATRESEWPDVLALHQHRPQVIPMLGLHPWHVHDAQPGWLERLEKLVMSSSAGIGECGLDFAIEDADRARQMEAFRAQWRLAHKLKRPLSIHCRQAWEALMALACEEGVPSSGAVVHAYSGSVETARELQALGMHLAFGCGLANPDYRRARKALLAVAEDRLLLETDAPDLPPRHLPASLNEPANLVIALEAAASLRGVSREQLARQLQRNAEKLFSGDRPECSSR